MKRLVILLALAVMSLNGCFYDRDHDHDRRDGDRYEHHHDGDHRDRDYVTGMIMTTTITADK